MTAFFSSSDFGSERCVHKTLLFFEATLIFFVTTFSIEASKYAVPVVTAFFIGESTCWGVDLLLLPRDIRRVTIASHCLGLGLGLVRAG